jgi:hypothetical protein
MNAADLVGALYCEECGHGGRDQAVKARAIDEEMTHLRCALERERAERVRLLATIERLRALCAEAAEKVKIETYAPGEYEKSLVYRLRIAGRGEV